MQSTKTNQRIAGLLYLIVAISGGFAHFTLNESFIVKGDAFETVQNINESEWLFRASLVSSIFCQTIFIFLPLLLYKLFKSISKKHATVMVVIALIGVPISCINMINQIAPLILINNSGHLSASGTEELNNQVMFFLELYNSGVLIAQIFWGLWLFPLGYLIFKSGTFPKWLGAFLMLACFGYLIDSLIFFLAPSLSSLSVQGAMVAGLVEIVFCFWLLLKGIKVRSAV